MNKKLKKIKQINRKPKTAIVVQPNEINSILQNFRNIVLGFLTLTLLLVEFGSVPAQAIKATDAEIQNFTNVRCDIINHPSNNIKCSFGLLNLIPADFRLGIGGVPTGGTCTLNNVFNTGIYCTNIPSTSIYGDNLPISYSGTGLVGGLINRTINIQPLYTPTQDLQIPKTCNNFKANSSTDCTFTLPANSVLPDNYNLAIGVQDFSTNSPCNLDYPIVYCRSKATGIYDGVQPIRSTLNPSGSGSTITLDPFFSVAEEANFVYTCGDVRANLETVSCNTIIPPNRSIPVGFQIGVEGQPLQGYCDNYNSLTCNSLVKVNQNTAITSTFRPNRTNSFVNIKPYFGTSDIQNITCQDASSDSITYCSVYINEYYNFSLDPNFRIGVGSNLGGNCAYADEEYSFQILCTSVPTSSTKGVTVINTSLQSPTQFTSNLDDTTCIPRPDPFSFDFIPSINIYQIFQPIAASASACRPVGGSGGTIQISNKQPNIERQTSLQFSSQPSISTTSLTPTSETPKIPFIETASTKIYDPLKLKKGKTKPSFGVLSSSDDKASVEDPYICGGDIHGYVDYSGDYKNVEIRVEIKDSVSGIVTNVPAELDPITHLYVAKIDYNSIKEANYDINYSVYSRLSNRILDQGAYSTFITQNCVVEKPALPNESVVALARTGGNSNTSNLSFIIALVLGLLSVTTFEKDKESIVNNREII